MHDNIAFQEVFDEGSGLDAARGCDGVSPSFF
jgi:hypothetical protein